MVLTKEEKIKQARSLTKSVNTKMEKLYGKGDYVFLAGDKPDELDRGKIPVKNVVFNDEILNGGLSRRVITILYGAPGCGKTTLADGECIASVQEQGGLAVLCLTEGAAPMDAFRMCGVNLDELIIIPGYGNAEACADALIELLVDKKTHKPRNLVDLIVIDSISMWSPKAEVDKAMETGLAGATVGEQARFMSKFLRVIVGSGMLGDAAVLMIAQVRDKVSLYGPSGGETISGAGNAGRFGAKLIIRMSKPFDGIIYEGTGVNKKQVGHTVMLTVKKNNAPGGGGYEGTTASYEVRYGVGTDNIGPLFTAACRAGIVTEPTKSYYVYEVMPEILSPIGLWKGCFNSETDKWEGEAVKIHGKDNAVAAMRNCEELRELIKGMLADIDWQSLPDATVEEEAAEEDVQVES